MNIIFTVCNRFSLANAQVLADSVFRFEPDAAFCLCWVDTIPLPELPSGITVVRVSDLALSQWERMCSRYLDFELLAAVRPWFAKFLIETRDVSVLTFLAPTTLLFTSIGTVPLETELALTPNITSPLKNDNRLDDKRILNIGMFNSGAWSLRKSEKTLNFLKWWAERTSDRAKFDLCNGMCMDQLWLNYAPVWVEASHYRTDPAWHYGLSKILGTPLTFENEQYKVNGIPLISVDFTGLAGFDPVWSAHRDLIRSGEIFKDLYHKYEQMVSRFYIASEKESAPVYGRHSADAVQGALLAGAVRLLKRTRAMIDQF